MKILDLLPVEHSVKIGDICDYIEPNIIEDTLFLSEGVPVGFYIRDISKHHPDLSKMVSLANTELLSDRVPKQQMMRSTGMYDGGHRIKQYSTILGSVAARPHLKRPYHSISSVHGVETAKTFIKAMLLAVRFSEDLIKDITPNIYAQQMDIFKNVPKQWKFGRMFTSSISNFNISAPFHIDGGNIRGCVNVIICKRQNSKGGCTTVPDYGITVDSCDNSMLVYPAWRNVHGVTPIVPLADGGYRNTLIFYPLKAFLDGE